MGRLETFRLYNCLPSPKAGFEVVRKTIHRYSNVTKRRTKRANALARHRRTDYALGYFEAEKLVTGELTGTKSSGYFGRCAPFR